MLYGTWSEPDYIDPVSTCNIKLVSTVLGAGFRHDMGLQNERGGSEKPPRLVQYQIK